MPGGRTSGSPKRKSPGQISKIDDFINTKGYKDLNPLKLIKKIRIWREKDICHYLFEEFLTKLKYFLEAWQDNYALNLLNLGVKQEEQITEDNFMLYTQVNNFYIYRDFDKILNEIQNQLIGRGYTLGDK